MAKRWRCQYKGCQEPADFHDIYGHTICEEHMIYEIHQKSDPEDYFLNIEGVEYDESLTVDEDGEGIDV